MNSSNQLSLSLAPREPYAAQYLVPHTGIAAALETLSSAVDRLAGDPSLFIPIYIFGARGSGKTHLVQSCCEAGKVRHIESDKYAVFEFPSAAGSVELFDEAAAGKFVAAYESLKSTGGILLMTAECHPQSLTANPHVLSRILTAELCEICPPREEEWRPIIESLAERMNLRLSARNIEYLIQRIPAAALCFAAILARIDELSLSLGRPANSGVVRAAVHGTHPGKL